MPELFSERAPTYEEAIKRIREKYGDRARIMFNRKVPARGLRGLRGHEEVELAGTVAVGDAEVRKLRETQDRQNRAAILASVGKTLPGPDAAPEKAKPSGASRSAEHYGEQPINRVLEEIHSLKEHLAVAAAPPPPRFPVLDELETILKENDFSESYIQNLLSHLQNNLSAADLDNRVKVHQSAVDRIADGITCRAPVSYGKRQQGAGPHVLVLVGPTGVGKTTTIAKLAAVNGLSKKHDVRIFTIDGFRIGALAQVETYGEIMDIPVRNIESPEDLAAQLTLASDADLILIDTIGKSPRDKDRIEQMRRLLEVCGENADVHLALSATTKTGDVIKIMELFDIFGYGAVILTKLDETMQVGNLISVLSEKNCPVSYLTDGQSVPVDIELASPGRLLSRVSGLEYNEDGLSEQYPSADLTAAWR
ncbi:MAG: flagellar biosynthesis protein FlhF [Spirochaetales bacterium]|nr:MAG: flagellar biosynthesis protein FlhF [Spirochaetales bacterium]